MSILRHLSYGYVLSLKICLRYWWYLRVRIGIMRLNKNGCKYMFLSYLDKIGSRRFDSIMDETQIQIKDKH